MAGPIAADDSASGLLLQNRRAGGLQIALAGAGETGHLVLREGDARQFMTAADRGDIDWQIVPGGHADVVIHIVRIDCGLEERYGGHGSCLLNRTVHEPFRSTRRVALAGEAVEFVPCFYTAGPGPEDPGRPQLRHAEDGGDAAQSARAGRPAAAIRRLCAGALSFYRIADPGRAVRMLFAPSGQGPVAVLRGIGFRVRAVVLSDPNREGTLIGKGEDIGLIAGTDVGPPGGGGKNGR